VCRFVAGHRSEDRRCCGRLGSFRAPRVQPGVMRARAEPLPNHAEHEDRERRDVKPGAPRGGQGEVGSCCGLPTADQEYSWDLVNG
jgi:hypothetical protein